MDNEASWDLKNATKEKYRLPTSASPHPPHKFRRERAIQTFKSHFTAGLASLDPFFTLSEWDRLIPHAELTLNLLRAARSNPKLSAWAYLFGQFNYMATPVVPPGIKVLAHDKPANRPTWAIHGQEGWTIGPSLEHYRCITCFFSQQGR